MKNEGCQKFFEFVYILALDFIYTFLPVEAAGKDKRLPCPPLLAPREHKTVDGYCD
jgi:hypothetical protein